MLAPSFANPPFACPPDTILDVPLPPSVNRTRKIYWRGHRQHEAWTTRGRLALKRLMVNSSRAARA